MNTAQKKIIVIFLFPFDRIQSFPDETPFFDRLNIRYAEYLKPHFY